MIASKHGAGSANGVEFEGMRVKIPRCASNRKCSQGFSKGDRLPAKRSRSTHSSQNALDRKAPNMLGRTQAPPRASRTRGAASGLERSQEPATGLLQKIFPLFVAITLIVSMLPTAALAGVAEDEQQDAVPAAVEQVAAPADEATADAAADKATAEDAAQAPAEGSVDADAGVQPEGAESGEVAGGVAADPAAIEVKCAIIGMDADGNAESWLPESSFEMKAGDAADALTIAAFERAGLTADYNPNDTFGFFLKSITSPNDGRVLAFDQQTGRFWQLFVNGKSSNVGASSVNLKSGDVVTWAYCSFGQGIPVVPAEIEAKCSVIGIDADGNPQAWAPESSFTMKEGANAADMTIEAFDRAGLKADYDPNGTYGFYLKTITSPFDGRVLGWDNATQMYWQLFVNGKSSSLGASGVTLKAGDVVTWVYSATGQGIPTLPETIEVKCGVTGVDAAGNIQTWAAEKAFDVKQGATAADATIAAFEAAGLKADYDPDGAYGFYLKTITSPFDGRVLGWDDSTKKYWQLFINGKPSTVAASEVKLRVGDSVAWYYAADGASLPGKSDFVVDPTAPRPELGADWPGFAGGPAGPVVTAPTPTDGTQAEWTYDFKDGGWYATVSDPLIVDGDVFIVAMGKVQRIDGETGKLVASAPTGEQTQQICRLAYADGLIIVPMDKGKIAAYTADTLTCVWKTPALADFGNGTLYQAMSTVTIADGCIYTMFSPGSSWAPSDEGVMVCVSLKDGSVQWTKKTSKNEQNGAGYYWAGAATSGSELILGDDAGNVALIDGKTGDTIASIALSDRIRAGIVAADVDAKGNGTYLAVTQNDGVLHKIERSGNTLKEVASVDFAVTSTSTPSIVDGKAVVCGADSTNAAKGNGLIVVVDIATMTIESNVVAGLGLAQASPLISVQGDGTYAYFTCNNNPGGVYRYKLGDDKAEQIFIPEQMLQNFTIASVVADAAGNLYYTNDSGTLFKLSAAPSFSVSFETNGGSHMPASLVAQNKPMNKPGDPVREGHLFMGWFADKQLTQPWDFSTPIADNMTLYAKWGEDVSSGGGVKPPINPDELNPSVPEGNVGDQAPIVTVVPTYTVVTTNAPLSDVKKEAAASVAEDGKATPATAKNATGAPKAKEAAPAAASAEPEPAPATLNPLAIAGIALGVVALLGVILYFVFARRRAQM